MSNELQAMRSRIRENQASALAKWRPRSGCTFAVRETFKTLEANLSKAKQAADSAQRRVEQLRDDDTIAEAGKARLVREAIERGKSEVAKYQRAADVALTVIKAQLTEAALPKVDRTREALARDELRMRVEASPDPVHVMLQIVQDPDSELAACAASSYGESLLRAKGIPKAQEAAQAVRSVAAASSVSSSDASRRAIGEAQASISDLEDALGCTGSITRTALEAASEAALQAGVRGVEA